MSNNFETTEREYFFQVVKTHGDDLKSFEYHLDGIKKEELTGETLVERLHHAMEILGKKRTEEGKRLLGAFPSPHPEHHEAISVLEKEFGEKVISLLAEIFGAAFSKGAKLESINSAGIVSADTAQRTLIDEVERRGIVPFRALLREVITLGSLHGFRGRQLGHVHDIA